MKRTEGPKGELYQELSELCRSWRAVPASYELWGVVKQGDRAQHVSLATEIWKGMYGGEEVALKVVGLSQGDGEIGTHDGPGGPRYDSAIKVAQRVSALQNSRSEARLLLC